MVVCGSVRLSASSCLNSLTADCVASLTAALIQVTEILRTKVVKSCDDWLVKLEAVRRLQEDPALQDTANKLTKYLEKSQNASDPKAQARCVHLGGQLCARALYNQL